jgi:hypothetical protein
MWGRRLVLASSVAVLVLCGATSKVSGDTDGRASGDSAAVMRTTVTGTVGGLAVPTADTVAFIRPIDHAFGPFTSNGVEISISNLGGSCALAQRKVKPPSGAWLKLVVMSPDAIVPGTYGISARQDAASTTGVVTFTTSDTGCREGTKIRGARSGSIVLTTVNPTTVEGTFSVTMATGEGLSGTFRAPVCDGPAGAGTFACGP